MKKLYLIATMAIATLVANAQEKLYLSTYKGTSIAKFDGKFCDVTVNRYMFTGWNTIALPFAMTQEELDETFGQNCRLEKLVGAEQTGQTVTLNFMDCKAEGLQANVPYILYYTGENANIKIAKAVLVTDKQPAVTFNVKNSVATVTMSGVKSQLDGKGFYGILARDNAQAQFVAVDGTTNGFLATRCYIELSSGNNLKLTTNHVSVNNPTSIMAIASENEVVDVYNTAGVRVASQIRANEVNLLQSGVYIVKGQKILVK